MKSSARRKGVLGEKHSPWKGFQASAAVQRRREREAAKAASGSSGGKQASRGSLDKISDRIAAERSEANSEIKAPKAFETVEERLKRLNAARALRKLQMAQCAVL